jgi:hypothetical protein
MNMRTWRNLGRNLFATPPRAIISIAVISIFGFWIYASDIIGKLIGGLVFPALAIGLLILIFRGIFGQRH